MRFPYVLIKEDKIKFKDSQLQGYKNLIDEKKPVDYDTIDARNYFLQNKNVFKITEE